jgi:hypothetical protein
MNKLFAGVGMAGITSAASYFHYVKHVTAVPVPSTIDAPALKPLVEHEHPLHIDVCQIQLPFTVSTRDFARAFFTSPVFQVERRILKLAGAGMAVTDKEIVEMNFVPGDRVATFGVIEYDQRSETTDEILFRWDKEVMGHSWLQAKPSTDGTSGTTLRFGSILNLEKAGYLARLFLPIHLMYAQIVLSATRRELISCHQNEQV